LGSVSFGSTQYAPASRNKAIPRKKKMTTKARLVLKAQKRYMNVKIPRNKRKKANELLAFYPVDVLAYQTG
jgi:hypothetical protein